jgi:hypothetical protein
MIRPEDGNPDGVHRRISLDSTDLDSAKAELEAQYGAGCVVSLWGDWEASRIRSQSDERGVAE